MPRVFGIALRAKLNYMVLLILGILLFIASFFVAGRNDPSRRLASPLRLGGTLIAVIGLLSASIVQIGAGEIGVQILYGRVQNDVLSSGLHFINPLMEVQKMDVKTQNYTTGAPWRDEGAGGRR